MKNIILGILLASASQAAFSLPGHYASPQTSSLFFRMDTNKDGLISKHEINKKSLLAIEFKNFDKNQDGNLDPREFEFFIMTANLD